VSEWIAARWALPLGALALSLAVAMSCVRFQPEMVGQSAFQIAGGHTDVPCEACHGPPPFGPIASDCLACHEEDRKDAGHHAGQTCNDAGCHSAEDPTWGELGIDHSFLPLENSHSLDCAACHVDEVNYADLVGQSDLCWSCHEDARKPGGHYAAEVDPLDKANAMLRWDCGPCHNAAAWNAGPRFHEPRSPHGAVTFADNGGGLACTDTAQDAWMQGGCVGCHPNPTNFGVFECYTCHAGVHDEALAEDTCLSCHESGQATTDLVAPPNDVCTSLVP